MRKLQGIFYTYWQLNIIVRSHPIGTIRFIMPPSGRGARATLYVQAARRRAHSTKTTSTNKVNPLYIHR